MYGWWLTRTEVLMTANGDDVLLMVNKNWGIDDG
jgi:hypothetical protein